MGQKQPGEDSSESDQDESAPREKPSTDRREDILASVEVLKDTLKHQGAVALAHGETNLALMTVDEARDYLVVQDSHDLARYRFRSIASVSRTLLSICSNDSNLHLFDIAKRRIVKTLSGHASAPTQTAYLPRHSLLVSSSLDNTLRTWRIDAADVESSAFVGVLEGHGDRVNCVTPRGPNFPDQFLSGSGGTDPKMRRTWEQKEENSGRLWDILTLRQIQIFSGHTGPVTCIASSPEGDIVATAGDDQTVRFWDSHSTDQMHRIDCDEPISSMFWPKQREFHVVVVGKSSVTVHDARNFQIAFREWETESTHIASACCIDANRFAIASRPPVPEPTTCEFWSLEGKCLGRQSVSSSSRTSFGTGLCSVPPIRRRRKAPATTPLDEKERVPSVRSEVGSAVEEKREMSESSEVVSDEGEPEISEMVVEEDKHEISVSPSPSLNEDRKGAISSDQITALRLVGEGLASRVFRGELHVGSSVVEVAVKTFLVSLQPEAEEISKSDLSREIDALCEIHHENIVGIHGCYFEPVSGDPLHLAAYVVTEYCEGGNLENWLDTFGDYLAAAEKVSVLFQIVQGMMALHSHNVVHNALSPKNILVSANSPTAILKICDSGILARRFSSEAGGDDELTEIAYLPPDEQGDKKKIDSYAFGVLAWEIWTNERAYQHQRESMTDLRVLAMIHEEDLRPSLSECRDMPPHLKALISSCWSEDPAERPLFPDVGIFLEELLEELSA